MLGRRRGDLLTRIVADTDAVKENCVYAMGLDSFRLDYYSAGNVLDVIKKEFKATSLQRMPVGDRM